MDEADCILLYFAKQGLIGDARPWSEHRQIWNGLEPSVRDEIRDELSGAVAAYIGKQYRQANRENSG